MLMPPQDGSYVYVKWHWKPDAGIATLTSDVAMRLAGEEPDYHIKDIYDAIEAGNHPSWTLNVQVMTPEQASKFEYDIFDDTYTWPHKEFPLRPIGKMTLTENVCDLFSMASAAR